MIDLENIKRLSIPTISGIKYDVAAKVVASNLIYPGNIVNLQTYRYGPVKKGQLFKIGSKGRLVNARRKEARFIAVIERQAIRPEITEAEARNIAVRVL